LFKGHYYFEFEIGEKCVPSIRSSEYLAQMKFIQDLKPSDKEKNVDVFTQGVAAFALPVDKVIEIPIDTKTVKKFRPEIHRWVLIDEKTGKNVKTL